MIKKNKSNFNQSFYSIKLDIYNLKIFYIKNLIINFFLLILIVLFNNILDIIDQKQEVTMIFLKKTLNLS